MQLSAPFREGEDMIDDDAALEAVNDLEKYDAHKYGNEETPTVSFTTPASPFSLFQDITSAERKKKAKKKKFVTPLMRSSKRTSSSRSTGEHRTCDEINHWA